MTYCENYSDFKQINPENLRGHMRNIILDGLSLWNNLTPSDHLLRKPRVQFIYIHHVFKDEEVKLYELLKRLAKNHEFISYSEAVSKVLNCQIDKPYITVSIDDGFKNNLRAAQILNDVGAKACFFVNPSMIGETNFTKFEAFCKTALNFPPVEFLNWDEIHKLQVLGHEIGAHTMNHINIAEASSSEIQEDMEMCFSLLKEKCGLVEHFAFPYGRFFHFNELGRRLCFETGFQSCATAERGCHINHNEKLAPVELSILRDHVILDWNIKHIDFFLKRSAQIATQANNTIKYDKV